MESDRLAGLELDAAAENYLCSIGDWFCLASTAFRAGDSYMLKQAMHQPPPLLHCERGPCRQEIAVGELIDQTRLRSHFCKSRSRLVERALPYFSSLDELLLAND